MALLLLLAVLPWSVQARSSLTVGVLAPDTGPARLEGRQIKAGVETAIDTLRTQGASSGLNIKFLRRDFTAGTPSRTKHWIENEGVDVVIGGASPRTALALLAAAKTWRIPTVVLSNVGIADRGPLPDHVLQLGLSEAEAYKINLSQWIQLDQINKLSLLYDAENKLTSKYGLKLIKKTLSGSAKGLELQDLSSLGMHVSKYGENAEKIEKYAPMGIVMSTRPWDMTNQVAAFEKAGVKTAVFVAPSVAAIVEMADLAKQGKVKIVAGAQFWPKPDDVTAQVFMEAVRGKLGWVDAQAVSTVAVRANDAILVIQSAWNGDGGWAPKAQPWANIDVVQGITGQLNKLELAKANVMIGPTGLKMAYPNGKLEFRSNMRPFQ